VFSHFNGDGPSAPLMGMFFENRPKFDNLGLKENASEIQF